MWTAHKYHHPPRIQAYQRICIPALMPICMSMTTGVCERPGCPCLGQAHLQPHCLPLAGHHLRQAGAARARGTRHTYTPHPTTPHPLTQLPNPYHKPPIQPHHLASHPHAIPILASGCTPTDNPYPPHHRHHPQCSSPTYPPTRSIIRHPPPALMFSLPFFPPPPLQAAIRRAEMEREKEGWAPVVVQCLQAHDHY